MGRILWRVVKKYYLVQEKVKELQEKLEKQRQDDEIAMEIIPTTNVNERDGTTTTTMSEISSDSGSYLFSKINQHGRRKWQIAQNI